MNIKDLFVFNKKYIKFYIILGVLFVIVSFLPDPEKTETVPKDDPSEISISKYGDEYPFTIDNLKLKCESGAVWVEDGAKNKWALNGLADGKFQGKGDYKGYTAAIEKPNPDMPGTTLGYGSMLSIGLKLCK